MANEMYVSLLDEDGNLREDYILEQLKTEGFIKLDYKIEDDEKRVALVKLIVDNSPPERLTDRYITALKEYILDNMTKEERKKHVIITPNHEVTINKREMSFEGLISKFENGEDGIYNMIANDKNIIFAPKAPISEKDRREIPFLDDWCKEIEKLREKQKTATGREAYLLHKQIKEMSKDQYVIKAAYKKPIYFMNLRKSLSKIDFSEKITVYPIDDGRDVKVEVDGTFSLLRAADVSALLCLYSKMKEDTYGKFWSDGYYMMMDLEDLVDKTLKDNYPMYYDLVIWKIDGKTNDEIQQLLLDNHGSTHSVEYISSLWRKKIPKMLADQATSDYLDWYFTNVEVGKWKRCSRCGQTKLAINRYFSKNNTSKDGLYSICKECRNKKNKKPS